MLLFNNLDQSTQIRIVAEMYEKQVAAGDILIQQGDTGVVASQLFVVKSGKFEVSVGPGTWYHIYMHSQPRCHWCTGDVLSIMTCL